ncbi:phage tail protein [Enterobacter hormaechei subsp. steigerwaltii]|uniref:phage tail-collar fiber domain-containing protein n=1 Tax=Enterobacter hormaechei TaxID=158836 RepID=UPI00215028EE|nr:phage tail protein [Enterobacter hormaechei]MCR4244748.1 phage tail protein [Enterobacter hormaechei]
MSQTVITKAFTEWKAQQAINNQPVTLDEYIFAYIPDLDVNKPIDNTETTPPADKIVHRQAVSKSGVINGDSVVYSVTLGADVGDFDFNWIGLANKATGTLAMIIHAPTQRKIKNASGQQGNVLVRSMLMEYSGAQAATNITTPAETWQIDFTARLASMDERQRLENIDLYGAAAFFGTGYLVAKSGTQYFVTKGAGYVAGLRTELAANQNITVSTKPVKVWLDVSWAGTLTSAWAVKSKITVAANLSDYVESGVRHFVFALASIDASGNITDLRPAGGLSDQALKAHEKSRNHPDATTTEKGFTKLSSATDSTSEAMAATPKAVKAAYDKAKAADDNANGRVPQTRQVNGHGLKSDFNITPGDIFKLSTGIGGNADLNDFTAPGLYYQPANAQAQTGKNYPEANAGSLEVYKHAGITQIYRVYNSSRSYIRTLYSGTWSAWTKQYDAANKPSPADINAVNKGGDTMTGPLKIRSVDALRIYNAEYGMIFRRSETNFYLIPTAKDQGENGGISGLRPLCIELTNGRVTLGNGAVVNGGLGLGVVSGLGGNSIALGDNDTGFKQNGDGVLDVYANSKQVMRFLSSGITSYTLFNMNAGASLSSTLTFKNGSSITSEKTGANPRNGRIYWGGDASRGNRIEFADDAGWKAYIERHPSNGVQLVVNGRINGSIIYSSGEVQAGGGKARLAADGNIYGEKWGNQWLDAYLRNTYQPKGNYTPAGQAYTKAESDGRFQPKGSYTPAGQAYTKAESNARFLQGWRLGAVATATNGNNDNIFAEAPNGAVVVSVQQKTNYTAVKYRHAQYNLNGTWYNAGVI